MIRKPTLRSLRRSRFFLLLVALVVLLLASPFLGASRVHEAYFIVLSALIMMAAVRIASESPGQRFLALVLAVSWLALSLWGVIWRSAEPAIGASLLFAALGVYVLGLILGRIISAAEVDFDILLGAVAAYLLIAIIWTTTYDVIHQLDPEAFSLVHGESRPYFNQFLHGTRLFHDDRGLGAWIGVCPLARK